MSRFPRSGTWLTATAVFFATVAIGGLALAAPPSANANYIGLVYQDLLHRPPSSSDVSNWESFLTLGGARSSFVLQIEATNEYLDLLIGNNYQHLLHRPADPGAINTYQPFLTGGGLIEQMQSSILGSPEYFTNRSGSTNSGFVGAMYSDVLNRSPNSPELTALLQSLSSGSTRSDVALSTLTSTEYRQDFVGGAYMQYLRRAADPAGLNSFVNAMQLGETDQQVVAALLSSDEYFTLAQSLPEPACMVGMLTALGVMAMRSRRAVQRAGRHA